VLRGKFCAAGGRFLHKVVLRGKFCAAGGRFLHKVVLRGKFCAAGGHYLHKVAQGQCNERPQSVYKYGKRLRLE